MTDSVDHPEHYTNSKAYCPSCGTRIECIEITKHLNFCLGSAIKYIWRADLKGDPITDLKKAVKCLQIEIERRTLEERRCLAHDLKEDPYP